jgi:hypothetical protein
VATTEPKRVTVEFWVQTLVQQNFLAAEFRNKLLEYIGCDDHVEKQHRDGKGPWCNNCGWSLGRPATSPFRGKVIE